MSGAPDILAANAMGLGDITALVTAIGVLVGAVASSAVKIGACLSDIRRQTARVQSTATSTKREVVNETAAIRDQMESVEDGLERLHSAVFERANITDARINGLADRIRNIESRDR